MSEEQNWGNIFDKMAKTAVRAEELGLSEIADVFSKSYDDAEEAYKKYGDKDKNIIALSAQFAERLARRIEVVGEWIKRNRIGKDELNGCYVITNYDYGMFMWAKGHGHDKEIDNLCIRVPFDSLSKAEQKSFDSQVDKK